MKKVLYVITKSNWGGAQKYVFDLATALPRDQFEPVVVYGAAPEGAEGLLAEKLAAAHVRGIFLPALSRDVNLLGDIYAFQALWRIFRKERPDVVHLNSPKAGALGALAARMSFVPHIIYTAHGWPFLEDRPAFQKKLIEVVSWVTAALAHSTITLSDLDYNRARAWPLLRNKIHKIYNGLGRIHDTPRTKSELRGALSSALENYNGQLIGTIAELHRNKGLMHMLRALTNVPDVHWVVLGEGEERVHLEKFARSVGLDNRVHFVGFKPDASELLSAFDLFVLPSVKEGFPYALLEAGVREVPIVTTSVGGIPELISAATGITVLPKDPVALAGAITATLKHPEEAHIRAQALHARILKEFDFETVTLPKTVRLYTLK